MWLLGGLSPRRALRRLLVLAVVVAVAAVALDAVPAGLRDSLDDARGAAESMAGRVGGLMGGDEMTGRVTYVVDGDTLDVALREDGRTREARVRLVGIDTPESKRPGTPVMCGSLEAEHLVLSLTFTDPVDTDGDGLLDAEGGRARRVVFEEDPTQDAEDSYGRRLGYVSLIGRERTLQEQLLAAGWADVYVHREREFERLDDFEQAARRAQRADRGVHAACGGEFDQPR